MRYCLCLLLAVGVAALSAPLNADDKKPLERIAFGSCAHQERPQPIWEHVLKVKPELFLNLGDNIYADTQDAKVMKAKYDKQSAQPGYAKLVKSCPIMATWDDHDYGGEDAGEEYPQKKVSQQLFLDFFGVAKDSPRRKQEGVYEARVFGPVGKRVQVIMLDTRYFRSALVKDLKRPRNLGQYVPVTDEKATILGATQWAWLKKQLEVPAEVRLVCSSIQVVAEDHGFEKWMNFPKEREKLYALLRATKAAGVVFLSGDRHLAELSLMQPEGLYPLFDLTSSGLNQGNKRWRALETNRHRVATMNVGDNYGLVRIDWSRSDPILSLVIHDDDGEVTIRQKVPLSRLQFGKAKKGTDKDSPDLAAEAMKHLGKEWTVKVKVNATGSNNNKSMIFLNSERDFKSEKNLTIILDLKALQKELKDARIGGVAKHYNGKTIEVTGTVSLFQKRPQIVVKTLTQVKIVE